MPETWLFSLQIWLFPLQNWLLLHEICVSYFEMKLKLADNELFLLETRLYYYLLRRLLRIMSPFHHPDDVISVMRAV